MGKVSIKSEIDLDELFEEAVKFTIYVKEASASLLQRQFEIGYARAARLLDQLEVGGVISEPLKWHITPKNEGKINRNFSQVKAGSGIYCYETESGYINYEKGPRGKILVEVLSNNEIKAEFQQGSCGSTFAFSDPKTFER